MHASRSCITSGRSKTSKASSMKGLPSDAAPFQSVTICSFTSGSARYSTPFTTAFHRIGQNSTNTAGRSQFSSCSMNSTLWFHRSMCLMMPPSTSFSSLQSRLYSSFLIFV